MAWLSFQMSRVLLYDVKKSGQESSPKDRGYNRIPDFLYIDVSVFTLLGKFNRPKFVPILFKENDIDVHPVVHVNIVSLGNILAILERTFDEKTARELISRLEPMSANSFELPSNLVYFLWFYLRCDITFIGCVEIIRTCFSLFYQPKYSTETIHFCSKIIEKLSEDKRKNKFDEEMRQGILYIVQGVLEPRKFSKQIEDLKIPERYIISLSEKVWCPERATESSFNRRQKEPDETTINPETIAYASRCARQVFDKMGFPESDRFFLEVGCGNGAAGRKFNKTCTGKITQTDICFGCSPNILKYDAGTAVEKFGKDNNILLLISPEPAPFDSVAWRWDIQTYILWIDMKKTGYDPSFIIFIGVLGRSDGSEGGVSVSHYSY